MANTAFKDFEKELLLSHFTIDNLHEAVLWTNASGNIFQVNEMACNLSGYTKKELTRKHIMDLNPNPVSADFLRYWQRLKKEKKVIIETSHKHKDGHLYDIEVTSNYIEYKEQEFCCTVVRDIRWKKMEEELLRVISEATSSVLGKDFFVELARHITFTLSMKYALITECANREKTRLRTLCMLMGRWCLIILNTIQVGFPVK